MGLQEASQVRLKRSIWHPTDRHNSRLQWIVLLIRRMGIIEQERMVELDYNNCQIWYIDKADLANNAPQPKMLIEGAQYSIGWTWMD